MQVLKDLAGAEDLLLDAELPATVTQSRGGSDYSITKVSAKTIPYTGTFGQPGAVYIKDKLDDIDTSVDLRNSVSRNTIADLKLENGLVFNTINVLGYYTKGDGGGGIFYWDSTSTEADNGGTIIQATGIAIGRWKRPTSSVVNIKEFGAKGDGITDDTNYIQNVLNYIKEISNFPEIKSVNQLVGNNVTKYTPYFITGGNGLFCITTPIEINRCLGLTISELHLKVISNDTIDSVFKVSINEDILGVQNLILKNITIEAQYKANFGIYVNDGLAITIDKCVINNYWDTGIRINQESHDVMITNCNIGFARHGDISQESHIANTTGIYLEANDNIVIGNVIYSSGIGIHIDSLSAGNESTSNHIYGIAIAAAIIEGPRNKLVNNFFDSKWGIILKGNGYVQSTITNNTFLSSDFSGTGFGIKFQPTNINTPFYGITIKNNLFNSFAPKGNSIVTDTTIGNYDYTVKNTLNIYDNQFRQTANISTRQKVVVDFTSQTSATATFSQLPAWGDLSYIDYSVFQHYTTWPVTEHAITGVALSPHRVEVKFGKAITGKLYCEAYL